MSISVKVLRFAFDALGPRPMAIILHTFPIFFSCFKMIVFRFKFYRNLLPFVGSDNGLERVIRHFLMVD